MNVAALPNQTCNPVGPKKLSALWLKAWARGADTELTSPSTPSPITCDNCLPADGRVALARNLAA